ncbi:MAG: hypothetical protein AB9866_21605 [Syntrophobacteraceae bacterium]
MENATPWVGYVISGFLALIVCLLGTVSWFAKGAWQEQKQTNKAFKESIDKVWGALDQKVSDAICKEREGSQKCMVNGLEQDFRRHTHSTLPDNAGLIVKGWFDGGR